MRSGPGKIEYQFLYVVSDAHSFLFHHVMIGKIGEQSWVRVPALGSSVFIVVSGVSLLCTVRCFLASTYL